MKSVINLIKTPQGYSLLQGDTQVNKSTSKINKEKLSLGSKKFTQQNFTIYPYIYKKQDSERVLIIPSQAHWFNMNLVHQIEKKALPEWFKIRKGILATMNNVKFQKHEQLYKKYRNYIIELGKTQYVSPLKARKGLAGDVCAIIRIQNFLEKWGLINYVHKKSGKNIKTQAPITTTKDNIHKDSFNKDKLLSQRTYGKDFMELLKKVTQKIRLTCHFCNSTCGIIWYQNERILYKKQLKKVSESKCQISSSQSYNYIIRLCATCFYQQHIPLILKHDSFSKRTVIDFIQPSTGRQQSLKTQQVIKIVDLLQKTKFNLKKSAQALKWTSQHLFKIVMTLPIHKLQKISRIDLQTDSEGMYEQANHKNQHSLNGKSKNSINPNPNKSQNFKEMLAQQHKLLENDEKQAYEQFFQSWLTKTHTKLQKLIEWDKAVQWSSQYVQSFQKATIADRLKLTFKQLSQ